MANEKRTDCMILGLLSNSNLTGYEIKKKIDKSIKYFWGTCYGSIYPTLKELNEEGSIVTVSNTDNERGKISYSITDKGRVILKEWLKNSEEKNEIRFETLLKIYFGKEIGRDETLQRIANFKMLAEKELSALNKIAENLNSTPNSDDIQTYYMLSLKFGIKMYKTHLEWCKEAENFLRGNGIDKT